jgi:hypothetical protein
MIDASDAPEMFTALLGQPIRSALRLELTADDESRAAVENETFAMALLADLTVALGGVVWDDLGFAYDPAEIEMLGHRGGTRIDSFAYASALAFQSFSADASERPSTNGVATDDSGLSLLETARKLGPGAQDAAASADLSREVLVLASLPVGAQRWLGIVRNFVADRHLSAALTEAGAPNVTLATADEVEAANPRFPLCVATFVEGTATLRVWALLVDDALPKIAARVRVWRRAEAVLGAPVSGVAVLESTLADGGAEQDWHRIDVLAAALAHRLSVATAAVTALGSGALLGGDELSQLLTSARGVSASWTAWSDANVPLALA